MLYVNCIDYAHAVGQLADARQRTLSPEAFNDATLEALGARCYLNERHEAGFYLLGDELRGLFSLVGGEGNGGAAVRWAAKLGARRLNTFDADGLVKFYERLGWAEVSRVAFDPALAPEGWDGETPDVVFMEYRGA